MWISRWFQDTGWWQLKYILFSSRFLGIWIQFDFRIFFKMDWLKPPTSWIWLHDVKDILWLKMLTSTTRCLTTLFHLFTRQFNSWSQAVILCVFFFHWDLWRGNAAGVFMGIFKFCGARNKPRRLPILSTQAFANFATKKRGIERAGVSWNGRNGSENKTSAFWNWFTLMPMPLMPWYRIFYIFTSKNPT